MNVTKAWVDAQRAKAGAPVREGWQDGALVIWVPGKPYNFKSEGHGTRGALMKHRRLVKEWRERTATRLLEHRLVGYVHPAVGAHLEPWPWPTEAPKRVTFTVYSYNAFDSDGREVTCSPSRDALKDMGLVTDDRDSARNVWSYEQVVTRKAGAVHGIAIEVRLA